MSDDDLRDELASGTPLQGGRYRIEHRVGRGGVATVYKALDVEGMPVALKILEARHARNPSVVERLRREVRFGETLCDIPAIVPPVGYGEIPELDHRPFIAFPFLRAKDLNYAILGRSMPALKACSIARDVADVLRQIHARQVIHRDVKPSNLIVLETAVGIVVQLLDFGFARSTAEPQDPATAYELTTIFERPGTVEYMSPEQAIGDPPVPQFDVYALGVTLWKMLAGTSPFEGLPPVEILRRKCNPTGSMRSLADAKSGLDPELVALVDQAIHPERAKRIETAEAFRDRLDHLIENMRGGSSANMLHAPAGLMGPRSTLVANPDPEAPPSGGETTSERLPRSAASIRGWTRGHLRIGVTAAAVVTAVLVGGAVAWSRTKPIDVQPLDVAAPAPLDVVRAPSIATPPAPSMIEAPVVEPPSAARTPVESEPSSEPIEPQALRVSSTVPMHEPDVPPPKPPIISPSSTKRWQTKPCLERRRTVEAAIRRNDAATALEQLSERGCWQDRETHLKLLVDALANTRRFVECVRVGEHAADPEVQAMVKLCKAKGTKVP